ncbi:MAG: hypothetical protein HQM11_11760 [SAR324 cluster bacterium]|nr:hypothetical protein [SAR324 cluster bacterium]
MLAKILNKPMKYLLICLYLLTTASWVYAFPQFTGRENAIELAKVIDKAQFMAHRVASVFVKNRTSEEFYLQVILDDGSSQDWYMDRIYEWVLTDQLLPINNQVIVFPSDESTEFFVLDKNQFYRLVLTSEAFVKTYEEHDLLSGKNLKYEIRRFRLILPEEEARYKTDARGNRYRYVLELKNGSREVFTYLDAYKLMTQGAFIQEPLKDDIILSRAFQVQGIDVKPKQLEDELRNIWRFGVEVMFNQPIPLSPELFPFQVIEENFRDPQTGDRLNRFYIQVMFPNAEKIKDIPIIRTLEYLQHVSIVTDVENQKRIFLRAQINPDVFELPPYIEVTSKNAVIVHFFIVTDQSVAQRSEFVEPGKAEITMHPAMVPATRGTKFDEHYLKAVELIRFIQGHHDLHLKIQTYLKALAELQQASLNATKDDQLSQALSQRDVLYEVLPQMIIENTQSKLRNPKSEINKDELLQHLEQAENITENREILRQVLSLKNILK